MELLNSIAANLLNLPDAFESGDNTLASITSSLAEIAKAVQDEMLNYANLETQLENLKVDVRKASEAIAASLRETMQEFQPTKPVIDEEAIAIAAALKNGKSFF